MEKCKRRCRRCKEIKSFDSFSFNERRSQICLKCQEEEKKRCSKKQKDIFKAEKKLERKYKKLLTELIAIEAQHKEILKRKENA